MAQTLSEIEKLNMRIDNLTDRLSIVENDIDKLDPDSKIRFAGIPDLPCNKTTCPDVGSCEECDKLPHE